MRNLGIRSHLDRASTDANIPFHLAAMPLHWSGRTGRQRAHPIGMVQPEGRDLGLQTHLSRSEPSTAWGRAGIVLVETPLTRVHLY